MQKQITRPQHLPVSPVKQVKAGGILPFTEKPSAERAAEPQEKENRLCASELFSLFTADIINEQVVFTR